MIPQSNRPTIREVTILEINKKLYLFGKDSRGIIYIATQTSIDYSELTEQPFSRYLSITERRVVCDTYGTKFLTGYQIWHLFTGFLSISLPNVEVEE